MSKKFTGITSAGSAIPVYDKDAHSALQNKADVSALTAYQEKGDYYSASNPSGFLTAVPEGYATTGDLEDLSTAIAETFQPQSAMTAYLTAVPEGYATTGDVESAISGKQDISGMSAYQSRGDMSSYASKAFVNENYYSKTLSDNRYQAQSSMSAFYPSNNPSGFITGVDLTPYQEKSAMSAYQAAGDYLSASESANFYPMTGNPSGFLTEHQSLDGLMQTSGLEYDGDKISGYMGSAFKAGDELPSGVMNTSALEYNAVNEISGYNGSAIAQYGAEKQFIVHDDTLVHLSNSAQYALGVNLSAVAQLLGVDETVLWTTANSVMIDGTTTLTAALLEPASNFKILRIICSNSYDQGETFKAPKRYWDIEVDDESTLYRFGIDLKSPNGDNGLYEDICNCRYQNGIFSAFSGKHSNMTYTENSQSTNVTNRGPRIFEVIGIGRKA